MAKNNVKNNKANNQKKQNSSVKKDVKNNKTNNQKQNSNAKKDEKVLKTQEEFFDEKPKKDWKDTTFNKVMNVILWIVLLAWMAICLVDFYQTHQEKEPMFCLKKEVTKYDDGEVKSCLGLGYKIYHYNRKSFKAIEFGPFWSKDRSAE